MRRQQKFNLNIGRVKSGFSLIEIMIVLAISGFLVVVAIGTLGNRQSITFQNNVRKLANDIKTVANETRSGLGPTTLCDGRQIGADGGIGSLSDGTGDIIQVDRNSDEYPPGNPPANCPDKVDPVLPDGHVIFGEALEFDISCGRPPSDPTSEQCLRVIKLAQDGADPSSTIYAYERYRIDLVGSLEFVIDGGNSTYGGGAVGSLRTLIGANNNLMIVYRNDGQAFVFGKTDGVDDISIGGYLGDAAAVTNYNTNQGEVALHIREGSGSNRSADIDIGITSPNTVEVRFP